MVFFPFSLANCWHFIRSNNEKFSKPKVILKYLILVGRFTTCNSQIRNSSFIGTKSATLSHMRPQMQLDFLSLCISHSTSPEFTYIALRCIALHIVIISQMVYCGKYVTDFESHRFPHFKHNHVRTLEIPT